MSEPKKGKKKKINQPQNLNLTPPATPATEPSQGNSTTEQNVPPAAETTQPLLSGLTPEAEAEAKAQLKQMADLLGVTQLADEVKALSEIVRGGQGIPRGTPSQGKPGASGLEALLSSPFVQGLLPVIAKAISGLTGGGGEASGVDSDILKDVKGAYIERQKAITNAANLLVDTVKGGGEIVRNSQTGVIEIRAPQEKAK